MATLTFMGFDVSKRRLDGHLLSCAHPVSFAVDNQPSGFEQILRVMPHVAPESVYLAMEATGRYFEALACWAHQQGFKVFVLNPLKFKRYAESRSLRGHKNDAVDARLIGEYIARHYQDERLWTPPSQTRRELKEMTRRLASLEKKYRAEHNALGHLPVDSPVCASHERVLKFLAEERVEIQAQIQTLIAEDKGLTDANRRVQTIPGIGPKTAQIMLAELGDISRFERAKDITAWSGLVPRPHRSGSSIAHQDRIARGGCERARRALYMAAVSALRTKAWKPWVDRQTTNGKQGKRLVVAMMDKLARTFYGVLKSAQSFQLQNQT
jgi:transposase